MLQGSNRYSTLWLELAKQIEKIRDLSGLSLF